jgi:hypothetical protein
MVKQAILSAAQWLEIRQAIFAIFQQHRRERLEASR